MQTLADIRASLKGGKPAISATTAKPTSLDAIRAQLKGGKSLNTGGKATGPKSFANTLVWVNSGRETVIGIRATDDPIYGPGNYRWLITVAARSLTRAAFDAAVKAAYPSLEKGLSPGSYLLSGQQINGQTVTWTPEVAFHLPAIPVGTSNPSGFAIS